MNKLFSILLLTLITVSMSAQQSKQSLIWFEIQKGGYFSTQDGKDYLIYNAEGKTAKELYEMVCVNVSKTYQSPKTVMSSVEDKSISIRAKTTSCLYKNFLGMKVYYEVYYNLLFEFKDGKIKISAPVINSMYEGQTKQVYFSKVAKSYFNSDGTVKKKSIECKRSAEVYFCLLIGELVGAQETKDDDW